MEPAQRIRIDLEKAEQNALDALITLRNHEIETGQKEIQDVRKKIKDLLKTIKMPLLTAGQYL